MDKKLQIPLQDYNVNGILHVGAGRGEYARFYHRLGVHQVMWFEKEQNLYGPLYEGTKAFGMRQRIMMNELGDQDSPRIRSFKSLWRVNAPWWPHLETYDMLHLTIKNNKRKVLEGFEELTEHFKIVVLSNYNDVDDADEVEYYLNSKGFQLNEFSGDGTERLFVKSR